MSNAAASGSRDTMSRVKELQTVLAQHLPYSSVPDTAREALAAAARIEEYDAGELVLDAFADPSRSVYVVVRGQVGLWHDQDRLALEPSEILGTGGTFGYSAALTDRTIGPRATALTPALVACIPGHLAAPAFVTKAGARFLTDNLLQARTSRQPQSAAPISSTAGDLAGALPLIVPRDLPAREVARQLSAQSRRAAVVQWESGRYAVITDNSLRERVLVEGLPPDAPAEQVAAAHSPVVAASEPAAEALLAMIETGADAVLVLDGRQLVGVISVHDFALLPVSADVGLHLQLRNAASTGELVTLAQHIPDLLDQLLTRGLAAGKVISAYSTLIDSFARRAIDLEVVGRQGLPMDAVTWLALGSNGRREAVLSSDIDSGLVFPDGMAPEQMQRYRDAFGDLDHLLAQAGFAFDEHGVSGRRSVMSRSRGQWESAIEGWLGDPTRDQGAIMISLLLDARQVVGAPLDAEAAELAATMRQHPGTVKLLLEDALARRARRNTSWESLWRKADHYDIKEHALLPLVNLARWSALAIGSLERSTPARLKAAAGSTLLPQEQANTLVEVFEVLQQLRLRYQIEQRRAGIRPSDALLVDQLSPIDRSVVTQAAREISAAQKRYANLGAWTDPSEWAAPAAT